MSTRRVMDELEEELYGSAESAQEPPQSAIEALIEQADGKALLELLKAEKSVASRVFRGFQVGARALGNPLVRRRLVEEIGNEDELRGELLKVWRDWCPDLCEEVSGTPINALRKQLPELVEIRGGGAVWLTLAGDQRKTAVQLLSLPGVDWSTAAPSKPAAEPQKRAAKVAPPAPAVAAPKAETDAVQRLEELQAENAELRRKAASSKSSHERARSESRKWRRECEELSGQLEQAQEQNRVLANRVDRQQRRCDRLEEQKERLERELRKLRKQQPQAAAAEPEASADVVVQAPPTPKKRVRKAPGSRLPGLVWHEGSRKHSVPLEEIVKAVETNNVSLVREWSESIRRLARNDREQFQAVRAEIGRESEHCAYVLTRNTEGVVVDGSNICHYEHDQNGKAKLANLLAARGDLRERRFFPILLYVDASLPHQIDQPETLAELIERGEIRMVVSGTSADDEITRVAREHGYYVMTNDRGITEAIDPELELPVITYSIELGYFYCHE